MSFACRFRRLGTTGLMLLFATACTETDQALLDEIGVTRLFLVDPTLTQQNVIDPDSSVQIARWSVASATLRFENRLIDLVQQGQDCVFVETALFRPVADGPCASGIVIEAGEDGSASLFLTLDSMELSRAEPLDLSRSVDFDGDTVPNDGDGSGSAFDAPCGLGGEFSAGCDDNCPLIPNQDQADDNEDGIGNACTTFDIFQGVVRDSDGDGVPDPEDNCVWIANPDQADTTGLAAESPLDTLGIPDGIGDACEEQVATVQIVSSILTFEFALLQPLGGTSFLTIDFGQAVQCNWESLSCVLDADQIVVCGDGTTNGCP